MPTIDYIDGLYVIDGTRYPKSRPSMDEEIQALLAAGVIPKSKLEHGAYYRGECRNAEYARWNAELGRFLHWGFEYGRWFIDEISHLEDERYFDVFLPIEKVAELPESPTMPQRDIPLKEWEPPKKI